MAEQADRILTERRRHKRQPQLELIQRWPLSRYTHAPYHTKTSRLILSQQPATRQG